MRKPTLFRRFDCAGSFRRFRLYTGRWRLASRRPSQPACRRFLRISIWNKLCQTRRAEAWAACQSVHLSLSPRQCLRPGAAGCSSARFRLRMRESVVQGQRQMCRSGSCHAACQVMACLTQRCQCISLS